MTSRRHPRSLSRANVRRHGAKFGDVRRDEIDARENPSLTRARRFRHRDGLEPHQGCTPNAVVVPSGAVSVAAAAAAANAAGEQFPSSTTAAAFAILRAWLAIQLGSMSRSAVTVSATDAATLAVAVEDRGDDGVAAPTTMRMASEDPPRSVHAPTSARPARSSPTALINSGGGAGRGDAEDSLGDVAADAAGGLDDATGGGGPAAEGLAGGRTRGDVQDHAPDDHDRAGRGGGWR